MFQKPAPVTLLDDNDQRAQSFALDSDEIDEEIGHLTLSLGEDESELEESGDALSQLEELASGLESVAAVLEDNPNGADSMTLRFAKQAHISFAKRVENETPVYATESIGGSVSRKEATQLALETIGESLKNAYQKFVAFVKRMWDAFIGFIDTIFHFFHSSKGRIERVKAKALKLKQANVQSRVTELQLPSRLHYAFQVKNRHIDPVKLVEDGQFVSKIQQFAEAYAKYSTKLVSELSNWLPKSNWWDERVRLSPSLLGALNPEQLITSSFQGEASRSPTLFAKHMDIPGNRVVTVSTPLVGRVENNKQFKEALTGMKVKVRDYEVEGKPQETIPQLTLDNVITICDEASRCLTVASKYDAELKRLNGERAKLLRSVGILLEMKHGSIELHGNLRNEIVKSISQYIRQTLGIGATWINLMRRIVLSAADVAYLSLKQYAPERDASGNNVNPFAAASIVAPAQLTHQSA